MFENEYITRLIKGGVKAAIALFAGKDAVKSDFDIDNQDMIFSADDLLEIMIRKYLKQGEINKAENILFEAINSRKTKKNLETAIFFYEELGKWNKNKLLECNFSEAEIEQGLKDIKELYSED